MYAILPEVSSHSLAVFLTLEPGMTFHFMPGLWMADWGLEITETILIRDEGPAEPLCSQPRQLHVKP